MNKIKKFRISGIRGMNFKVDQINKSGQSIRPEISLWRNFESRCNRLILRRIRPT